MAVTCGRSTPTPTEAASVARFEDSTQAWGVAPCLDYDAEIRQVLCSTNAIESLSARYRRAVRAHGQAAIKCLYLTTRALDATGKGCAKWTVRGKRSLNAFAATFEGRIAPSTTN